MKKKLLIVACCLTAVLAGCGEETQPESGLQVEAITVEKPEQTNESEETKAEEGKTEEQASAEMKQEDQAETKPVSDADIINGNPEVGAVTAYLADGSEVLLTENTDGTYLSGDGVTYYFESDGVYRAKGHDDMYSSKPQTSNKESSGSITQEQALEAIRKYCFANDPELESMMKSGDYTTYFETSTNDAGEIVVLYRSYTAAQIRYYINPTSGDVYVTELVPGIIDDEQKTAESFNIKDYISE